MTLRILTLSTLYPDESRPNFGVFVERQTRELVQQADFECIVMAPVGIPPWPLSRLAHYAPLAALPKEELYNGLEVHRPHFTVLPGTGGRFHVGAMTRAILPLVRALHEEKAFDVIDASFFFPDGPVAANLSKALGIPFSVKARGADIHYWGSRPATRSDILRAAKEAGGLLAVSEAMRRSMAGLGMDKRKIRVHYTGVDLDRFDIVDRAIARADAKIDLNGPILLSVGALVPRKGHDLLIRAMRDLPDAHLYIAGNGPERTALGKLATECGVSLRVHFLGAVPHERLPTLINAADIMVLPSVSEGLANAWVEALACGTPIIISDVGGARELLRDKVAGQIVERNPGVIARAIRRMLKSPPDRIAVRQAALPFTWAANANALAEHFTRIVRQASAPQ